MPEIFDPSTLDVDYCTFTVEGTGDEYNSLDWMLILTNCEVGDALARRYEVEVPGRDGKLDMSEALGGVYFENRRIELTFACINYTTQRHMLLASTVRNAIDGKLCRVSISSDIGYFWRGRCQVDATRPGMQYSELVVTVDAEPYKYDTVSSYDAWQWDPFSFVSGVIVQVEDVVLNNETKSVTLPRDPARGKPILWLNSGGSGSVSAKTSGDNAWHLLRSGKNVIPEVRMSATAETTLMLKGTGTVGIEYRIGSL